MGASPKKRIDVCVEMNDRHIEHTYTKDKVFNVVNVVTQELVFFEAVLIDTLFLLLTNNYAYALKVFLQPFSIPFCILFPLCILLKQRIDAKYVRTFP